MFSLCKETRASDMKIVIGGDHAGFEYKGAVVDLLRGQAHEVDDKGPFSSDSVDYPDFAHQVSKAVTENVADFGILICGSGNGVAMTANKYAGIRAALCWNVELAVLAREHNNANILCLPARFISKEVALACVDMFIKRAFEGGRHQKRVSKIPC